MPSALQPLIEIEVRGECPSDLALIERFAQAADIRPVAVQHIIPFARRGRNGSGTRPAAPFLPAIMVGPAGPVRLRQLGRQEAAIPALRRRLIYGVNEERLLRCFDC